MASVSYWHPCSVTLVGNRRSRSSYGSPTNTLECGGFCRDIPRTCWEQSEQTREPTEICDVQDLIGDCLESLIRIVGAFDLVIIGGSPCNNISSSGPRDGSQDFYGGWIAAINDSPSGQRKGLSSLIALSA
ncbi:DNA (cytosine-5)-methyltransferase DRM2-like [Hordeum vulgare]|nr:DNA (cytosine-5)-methyltransferase DRM2-like [Hordeum vulgare]